MTYYLFDSIRLGLIIAVIVETIMLLCWSFTHRRWAALGLCAGPLLAGLTILLDYAVETNREQAERITRQIVAYAEIEDAEHFLALLSPDIQLENGMNFPLIENKIRTFFARPLIDSNRITELRILTAQDEYCCVELCVLTLIDPQCPYRIYASLVKSEWRFEFTRHNLPEYRLQNFTMLSLNGQKPIDVFRNDHLR